MLTIRFNRIGRHNHATFRIAVQEHSIAPGGRHVAVVGSYDPHTKTTVLREEEIRHWLSVGAKPSATVHNLLVKKGIIRGKKIAKGKKYVAPAPAVEEAPAAVEAAPAEEASTDVAA